MDTEMAAPNVKSTLPTLPAELIEHIIRSSLPPLAFPTFRLRYDLLLSYSSVSRIWNEAAQAELYSHIWLGAMEDEDLLWQLVGRTGKGWTNRARALWCGHPVDLSDRRVYSAHFVDRALSYCPNVELVCLSALGLTAFDFSAFDRIKELRCSWIELYGTGPAHIIPRPPNPLPSLARLTLISPYLNGGLFGPWSSLLNPTTMPNLRHLTLHIGADDDFQDYNEDWESLPNALLPLGPQLETLQLLVGDIEIVESLLALVPECTSLRFLRLFATEQWCISDTEIYEAPKLPPSLEVLIVDPGESFASSSFLGVHEDLTTQVIQAASRCPTLRIVALSESWFQDMGPGLAIEYSRAMLEMYLEPLSSSINRQGKRLLLSRHDEDDEWWQACEDWTQPGYFREVEELYIPAQDTERN